MCRLFRWRLSHLKVIVSKRGELADSGGFQPFFFFLLDKFRTIGVKHTRVAPNVPFGLLFLCTNFFDLFWLTILVLDQLICLLIIFLVLLFLLFYFLYLLGFDFEWIADSFLVAENWSRSGGSRKLAFIPTAVCWVLKDFIKFISKRVLISVRLPLLDSVNFFMQCSPSS